MWRMVHDHSTCTGLAARSRVLVLHYSCSPPPSPALASPSRRHWASAAGRAPWRLFRCCAAPPWRAAGAGVPAGFPMLRVSPSECELTETVLYTEGSAVAAFDGPGDNNAGLRSRALGRVILAVGRRCVVHGVVYRGRSGTAATVVYLAFIGVAMSLSGRCSARTDILARVGWGDTTRFMVVGIGAGSAAHVMSASACSSSSG